MKSDVSAIYPKLMSGIYRRQQGDKHLLLHPDKPSWLVVNNLGWEVAKLCDGTRDVDEIISVIAARYCMSPSLIQNDIITYLSNLSTTSLLLNQTKKKVNKRAAALKRLHLNISGRCNLTCVHCGNAGNSWEKTDLSKEKVFEIIDDLSTHKDASLAISGGEPLLHKDCFEILHYASKRLKTSLSTNATLINEEIARSLSLLDITLQISLDGHNPAVHDRIRGEGSFNKTMQGIKLLKRFGMSKKISFFVTVTKQNVAAIPEIITLAEETGIRSVRLMPVQKMGNAAASWDDISPSSEEYSRLYTYLYREMPQAKVDVSRGFQGFLLDVKDGCRCCRLGNSLFIDAGGDIYPCSLMTHPDFSLGNINTMSLTEAIESELLRDLISTCSSREESIGECIACEWKHFCQASCPGSVYASKGSLLDTDDLCDLRRSLYPEVIFDMANKKDEYINDKKHIEVLCG